MKKNSVTNNSYSWPRKNFVMDYGYRQPNNILVYLVVIHNQKEENIPLWITVIGVQKKFCQKNEYWWRKKILSRIMVIRDQEKILSWVMVIDDQTIFSYT